MAPFRPHLGTRIAFSLWLREPKSEPTAVWRNHRHFCVLNERSSFRVKPIKLTPLAYKLCPFIIVYNALHTRVYFHCKYLTLPSSEYPNYWETDVFFNYYSRTGLGKLSPLRALYKNVLYGTFRFSKLKTTRIVVDVFLMVARVHLEDHVWVFLYAVDGPYPCRSRSGARNRKAPDQKLRRLNIKWRLPTQRDRQTPSPLCDFIFHQAV